MGVARHPGERQGGTLEGEGNRAVGDGPGRCFDAAVDVSCRACPGARAGGPARGWRAARPGVGEEAPSRLFGGAGDPRLVRDADRGRRVPRRCRAFARRFGAGASARSRAAGADDAGPVSAPFQPRPYRPAQPGTRRVVRACAPAARAGDGDARSGRDLYRASRPGRLAAGDARHLQGQGLLAPALSARRASGYTRSSETATPAPRPARPVSFASACAGCPPVPGCFCVPTRAFGGSTSSPTANASRSPTPSGRR